MIGPDGAILALKRIRVSGEEGFEQFVNEIDLLFKLKGKDNIIRALRQLRLHFYTCHTKIGLLQCTRESVLESKSGVNLHAELMDQSVDRKHGMVFMVFEYGEIDLHKLLQKQAGKPIKDNFIRLYWQQV